jgi:hypothetical protein
MGCPIASRRKRILEFKEYPGMVKMYCRQGEIYRKNHPNSPNNKMFKTVYDWFVFSLFCDNVQDFNNKFGASELFGDDEIDTKIYLENYFNIKF